MFPYLQFNMIFQILVPQYKETNETIKPLLDSISIQQNVPMNEIGVVIVNDGSDVHLTEDFLKSYPFEVEYHLNEKSGVSATRNKCLDYATADYVMFCDADDMFYSVCGLFIVFNEIKIGFDILISTFIEETRNPKTKEPLYVNHEMDSVFVHGKVFNRKFLLEKKIRFNPKLTIHEDSYFNCLAQKCSENGKYCPTPFYLWKWRDESVCRHDPKYILKTYINMLDSNTELILELMRRSKLKEAQSYVAGMIYDAYFTMNKDEWVNQENKEYRFNTEKRFKEYYLRFKDLFLSMTVEEKASIIVPIRNRFYQEGLLMESVTFDDWIAHVENDF